MTNEVDVWAAAKPLGAFANLKPEDETWLREEGFTNRGREPW